MKMNEYQWRATDTAVYPSAQAVEYVVLGLVGEAGEIANRYKKVIRDNGGVLDNTARDQLAAEMGDVLWYLAMLSHELGVSLGDIAESNLQKLAARKLKGTIHGHGDNR